MDHLSRTNRGWTQLLKYTEVQPTPIIYANLARQHVGGVNSWDIACHLESFLVSWLSKGLKNRRNALCGNEPGNGLVAYYLPVNCLCCYIVYLRS